jgi:hypothetical protein
MNLPVHSGPAECRLKENILICPCAIPHTTSLPERFQYLFEKFQKLSFLSEPFQLENIATPYQQRAERKDLPKNPLRRQVEAVLAAIEGSCVPLSFPPLDLILVSQSKKGENISEEVKLRGTRNPTEERFVVEFKRKVNSANPWGWNVTKNIDW